MGVLTLANTANALTLTWRAPESGPAVAGYYLYISDSVRASLRRIDVGDTTKHKISGLVQGRAYSFYLTAYNSFGLESDPSNTFEYEVPLTSPYVTISPLAGYGTLITWNSEANKSYSVLWKSDFAESNWKTISPVITAMGPSTSWVIGKTSHAHGYYAVTQLD